MLRWLHGVMAAAAAGLGALCLRVDRGGLFDGAAPLMVALMGLLGGSLMAMLPFAVQAPTRGP